MTGFNFLIVGCGRIGERHAGIINKIGKLKAVCDIIETKAEKLAQQYQTNFYKEYNAMLGEAEQDDVIVVCTPNGLHALHSIMALKKSCHVLCEKPMAINSADCAAMIKCANLFKKKLFIVKQNRFNPPVAAVKNILDEGKLGKIYSIQLSCFWNRNNAYYQNSWKGTLEMDGGTLYTQFSHFVDLLYWMFGDIKTAKAIIRNAGHKGFIEFEDTGVAILEFKNGIIGTINYTVNAYKRNMEGSLIIFGEKGSVKIGGQYLNELEYQEIENYNIVILPKSNPPNDYGDYKGSMSNHEEVYNALLDNLNSKENIETNSYDSLKTVEIIERIYQEARHAGN